MDDQTDLQLLRAYSETRSDEAFATLVRRHIDLVHSAAMRMACDSHLAQDVTQNTFVALAKNASDLMMRPVITGWLHRTAQNIAAQTIRTDVRRRNREQEATAMNTLLSEAPDASWQKIAPHLDAALGQLDDVDRDAVLLRYFEKKSAREIATQLGISDDAAQKRVSRAVERLREFFAKRGITVGTSGLAVVISANAVQAAPVGLAVTISAAAALAGTTLATATTATAIKTIAMTTLQKTVITATLAVVAGFGIYEARQASQLRNLVQTLEQQQAPLAEQLQQLQSERDASTNNLVSVADETAMNASNKTELLKLRGRVGVLQRQVNEANQKTRIAESKLAAELSSKAQFEKIESATARATKELSLALLLYLDAHDHQFPTNIAQLANELGGKFTIGGIDLFSLEFLNNSPERFKNPKTVGFRERLARQSPDGTWRRIYGFSDGSVHTATSNDGNFNAWEKVNTYAPPPN